MAASFGVERMREFKAAKPAFYAQYIAGKPVEKALVRIVKDADARQIPNSAPNTGSDKLDL